FFSHGYLGVDVFFVLSGYLITTSILEDLDKGDFSFMQFYLRRAKRLLPALYSTLLVTTVLAYVLLTPGELKNYTNQLLGSLVFVANIILPTQIGYFAAEAEGTPLLHIWSLSLEEQYYFTLPLLFFLSYRRWHLFALIVLFTGSLALCLAWTSSQESPPFLWRFADIGRDDWAFYLFPTRAWELLAGSICAWVMLHQKDLTVPPIIKWICLVTIFVTVSWGFDSVHPRGNALMVVIATAFLVIGSDKWLPKSTLTYSIEKIGDWSYSIYLVHWPLFVFAYVVFLEQIPFFVKGILIFISIAIGYVQYRYIENPFRYHWQRPAKNIWQVISLTSFALLLISVVVLSLSLGNPSNTVDKINEIRKTNYGLSEKCEGSFDNGYVKSECMLGNVSHIAVWGDSFAMHLVPGLAIRNQNLVQLTKSVCGPIVGLAPIAGNHNLNWAKECLSSNQQALELIVNSKDITHVILSSAFRQYFDVDGGKFLIGTKLVDIDADLAYQYLVKTINALRNAGKEPILVSPPPRAGFNVGACLERQDRNLFYARDDCRIKKNEYLSYDFSVNKMLSRVQEETNIRIVWLRDWLCDDQWCKTQIGDKYIYRDSGHLSIEGSIALLRKWVVGDDISQSVD
ncbi:acyltransferase family protein, partial [Nitrosomonas europaea]|uniref:acyltransferase family protein n=1 Tax=Nitrosomonas europaea TaxID=915 RepID=UPI000796FC79